MLYGHSMVALDTTTLIVYGGMSQPGYCYETNNTWLLKMKSIAEWEWQQPPVPVSGLLPPASGYHAACTCDGKMYVFGGLSEGVLINNFSCLDLTTWVWSPCHLMSSARETTPLLQKPAQTQKNAHQSYHHARKRGGLEDSSSERDDNSAMCRETEATSSASEKSLPVPQPSRRQGSTMIARNGLVYILGGATGRHCQGGGLDLRDVHVWDTRRACWLEHQFPLCPVMGIGRRHASVLLGDRIFCFGGSAPSTNHTCVLDLSTKKWNLIQAQGKVPSPRVSLTAHLCHNTIFVFGGSIHQGAMNSRTLYLLHPDKLYNASDFQKLEGEQYVDEEDYGDEEGWSEEEDAEFDRGNRFPRFQCAQQ